MLRLRISGLPATLALAAAFALSSASLAVASGDEPVALMADGRPIPTAPDVIASNKAGVTVRATRISTPPVIDGQLDERVYTEVKPITEFVQQDPHEGAPVSEHTESWVLDDDRYLYFRVPMPGRASRAHGGKRDAPRQHQPASER